MRWLALIALGAACGFQPSVAPADAHRDGGVDSRTVDAHEIPADGPATCYGTGLGVQVCLAAAPTASVDIATFEIIDTTAGSTDCAALVGPTASDYCVIAGTSMTIAGFIAANGTRPLVLLSLSTLAVSGNIDVASHTNGTPQAIGAGGDSTLCGGTNANLDPGGGFGGSLGTLGGNGGSMTPPGGKAGPAIIPTSLRGGCAGGAGLDFLDSGHGGHGGGAIDLIAVTTIALSGQIYASGSAGGGAGPGSFGGGGGGSGGLVVFDAPTVLFAPVTIIYANGGGGGGGSSSVISFGQDGSDPTGFNSGGNGGAGDSNGGNGGDGARYATDATDGADGSAGGNGGGGGGLGVVRVFQSALPTVGFVSPMPT